MDRGRSSYRGRRSPYRVRERRAEYHPHRSHFYRIGHQRDDRDRSLPSYHQGGGLCHYDDRPRSQRPYDHNSYGRRQEHRSHDNDFASHDCYRCDPQQCTTKEEDESVTIILMDIYSEPRVEVIRASVNHPENRRRPFDKGILLQRCLEDLRGLFTWPRTSRPETAAALGSAPQEPSASGVPTASTASVSAPNPSTSETQGVDKSDTSCSDRDLPTEAYNKTGDLPLGSHMRILEDLLNKIANHLGCEDLKALMQKEILSNQG